MFTFRFDVMVEEKKEICFFLELLSSWSLEVANVILVITFSLLSQNKNIFSADCQLF